MKDVKLGGGEGVNLGGRDGYKGDIVKELRIGTIVPQPPILARIGVSVEKGACGAQLASARTATCVEASMKCRVSKRWLPLVY